jgi:uncharacterized protein (TIGR03546 family)
MRSSALVLPRRIVHALVAASSPHEIAVGFTLGLVLGLVPKGNLIAVSLAVALFSLRINKGAALAAAAVFSLASQSLDPLAHKIGLWALTVDSMQGVYASLYNFPLGPWLGIHNTVVAGTLMLGAYVAYPAYWLARVIAGRLQQRAESLAQESPGWRGSARTNPYSGAAP